MTLDTTQMKRISLSILFGLVLLMSGCGREEEVQYKEIRPVRSMAVGEMDTTIGANYSGEVKARYESRLGFQNSGRIQNRLVEVGDHVQRDQPLMRLDPEQELLKATAADADVKAARNRVEQNRLDLYRAQQLLKKEFVSQAEVDQKSLALAESESQLKSALAQLEIAKNQRDYTELRSDRDGVISTISAETGEVVSAGQPVITVAADGEWEVVISIPESRVDELRKASSLTVSFWALPEKICQGTLRELAPDTDSLTRTYSARISLQEPDPALRLGMTASVFAPILDDTRGFLLPLTSIYHKDNQSLVWVVDGASSTVTTREVVLGPVQDNAVVVTQGLVVGETVVTAGVHMLTPGQQVNILNSPPQDNQFSIAGEIL